MDLKKEIEQVLETLKSKGYTRDRIESELKYSKNYIDQTLSKGGNKRFLNAITALNDRLLQNATLNNNPPKLEISEEEENHLKVAIRELSESTNRHSVIDERNSRSIERLITLLYKKFGIEDDYMDLPELGGERVVDIREKSKRNQPKK
jgi:hypothetical protein